MKYTLRIENLTIDNVFSSVSLEIPENTKNLLVGPSGSGKTLLLKSIASLTDYKGNIFKSGKLIDITKTSKDIGLFMNDSLLLLKKPYDNIIEPLFNLKISKNTATRKVEELSKELNILDILFKEIQELSYSERKMVIFARSIIHNPKIILLDNIFDGLDSHYKETIVKWIKKQDNKIILVAESNLENLEIFDNCIILNKGKVAFNDKVKKLIEDEKIIKNNGLSLPIILDLSNKLKLYKLIDKETIKAKELVDLLWQ